MYGQPVNYGAPVPTPEMAMAANMAMNTPAPMMAPPPQPMMMGPPMGYAPAQGPTIVTIGGNSGGGTKCPFCSETTGNIPRKRSGCVTWAWCACLFLFTGLCCFIPFCVDSCKDI